MKMLWFLPIIGCALSPAVAAEVDGGRLCYTPAETRSMVVADRLVDPFMALRNAAIDRKAEPLANRLCRWGDELIYEMTLLPRNGKVTRVYLRAGDGSPVNRPRN